MFAKAVIIFIENNIILSTFIDEPIVLHDRTCIMCPTWL